MYQENKNQLFRLAAVLYADNNYEVAPKTILRKVIESALLSNGNKSVNIHQLIDFIQDNYNLNFDEQEIKGIVTSDKEDRFSIKEKGDDTIVCLSERRKESLDLKLTNRSIDHFITEFEKEKAKLVTGSRTKDIIYRFLYELLSTNIESFKKLLDSKKTIEDLINVESHSYSPIEREIINEFLGWDNDDKNKAIFDIASYALEYCIISNSSGSSHIQLFNLKNKTFYLDTNVIFRALGINGENRQNRTISFLKKFIEVNTALVISKFSEIEFKDTISFYIEKLNKNPIHGSINPAVFEERYFRSFTDIYDFYYKWKAGRYNDSLELFEGHIMALYEKFKNDFKVFTDFRIPFEEKDEKTERTLTDIASSIGSFKNADSVRHGISGDYNDACNILLVESRRENKNSNIFEAKQFFVSTDQSLRRWDYSRNAVTPVVILPSQWLSILLRYINRTNDDFKSFVSFLNLPSGESQINSEKLHIILAGISEMTENFDQQYFIVQSLVQKKFDGILEKGIKDEEILERTKEFAKSELEKKVEEISKKHSLLQNELNTHKEQTAQQIGGLEQKSGDQNRQLSEKEKKIQELKTSLQGTYVIGKLRKWKNQAYWCIGGITLILIFFYFQLFHSFWEYNYVQKLIDYIDNNPSETKRDWMKGINTTLIAALATLSVLTYNRLFSKEKKVAKIKTIKEDFPDNMK